MRRSGLTFSRPVLGIACLLGMSTSPGEMPLAKPRTETAEPLIGITAPSSDVDLASVLPARIERFLAEEGDAVRAGQVVLKLDDSVQRERVAFARAAASSDVAIEHARARWRQADRDLDYYAKLYGRENASAKEYNDAVSMVEVRQREIEQAEFEREQAKRSLAREEAILSQYEIVAPFDGVLVERLREPGEVVDQLEHVARVVKLDPLHVRVDCPISMLGDITVGDLATVRAVGASLPARDAQVVSVRPVLDGGSQTFRVVLALPNAGRDFPAGVRCEVGLFHRDGETPAMLANDPMESAAGRNGARKDSNTPG